MIPIKYWFLHVSPTKILEDHDAAFFRNGIAWVSWNLLY